MISVILVNYNLSDNLVASIKSIFSNSSEENFEIIVVDNNSSHYQKDVLKKGLSQFNNVKIFYLEFNNGFGDGNNYGVNKSQGDIIFLLNPDTLLTNDLFEKTLEIFRTQPTVSVLGPKIVNDKKKQEKSVGKFPSLFLEFINIFFLSRFYEKKYFLKKVKNSKHEFIDVDWVTGSAMFIRREVFQKVGGFDTNFFMYSEEVDLCRRIQDSGGKIVYFPAVELIHIGSIGSKKNYSFFTKTSYESKYYYIDKHFKGIERLFILLFFKVHIIIQLFTWMFLYPFSSKKSTGKIKTFSKLIFTSKISERYRS